MGQALIALEEERAKEATDEFAHLEATFDLSYDVAKWLECAAHFSQVRFLRDEHGMLNIASKCLDLRRFTALTAHATEFRPDSYEDIKEPLETILEWMTSGWGGMMSRTSMWSSSMRCFWPAAWRRR